MTNEELDLYFPPSLGGNAQISDIYQIFQKIIDDGYLDKGDGTGDMLKSIYDTNNSNTVDNAERVNGLTVETSVPAGAIFTDNIYDDSVLSAQVTSNTEDILLKEDSLGNPSINGYLLSSATNGVRTWVEPAQGPEGPQGPQGIQGPRGLVGPEGPQGPQGIQGITGLTGPQGPQGLQGDTGATGPQGPAGATGNTGLTGPQGPQGLQGPKGDTGATGPQGPQGPAGVDGSGVSIKDSLTYADIILIDAAVGDMYIATDSGIDSAGTPYSSGDGFISNGAGISANSWTNVGSIRGPEGPLGPQGIQGDQGPQGLQGPKGDTGADGIQGPQGPVGATGPQGADGIQGPQGPAGADGLDGAQGPQGPVGATGPAGADGLDGAQGPQGPVGATGPAGPSAVSIDAGNTAIISPNDSLIYVRENTIATATNGANQTFNDIAVAINLNNQVSSPEVTIAATTFTVNTTGAYKINFSVQGNNTSQTRSSPMVFIEINGILLSGSVTYGYSRNTADGLFSINQLVSQNLQANDVIEFFVKSNDTNNLTITGSDSLFEIEFCADTKIYE